MKVLKPALAGNTDDLVSLVRLHQPALIILNFGLKGRNGGDWCAELKKHPEFAAIPIVILLLIPAKASKRDHMAAIASLPNHSI